MYESDESGCGAGAALASLIDRAERLRDDAAGAAGWSAQALEAALAGLDRLDGVLASVRGRLVVAEKAAGRAQQPGDDSYAASLARRSRHGRGEAFRQVRQADALATMTQVDEAVRAGAMPIAHLDALARTAASASPAVAAVLTSERGQQAVVEHARRSDATDFGRWLSRFAAEHDPAAHERGHQAQRRERFLTLSDGPDGTFLRGRLDSVAGRRLRVALEATGEAPDEGRSPQQAAADALVAVAERALSGPEASGASARPHVSFVLDAEMYAVLRDRELAREAGSPESTTVAGSVRAVPGAEAATSTPTLTMPAWEDGGVVPLSEIARTLCDCELTRVVVSAEGEPLDVGRTQRLYTGAQRRAVVLRDQGCVWPGCGRSPRWCEVHHRRWWDRDGGATSVENGVLLCVFHHHEVHRLDVTIERHRAASSGAAPPGAAPPGAEPPGAESSSASVGEGVSAGRAPDARKLERPRGVGALARARYTMRLPDGTTVGPPRLAAAQGKPAYAVGQGEPACSVGRDEPAFAVGRDEPTFAVGRDEPTFVVGRGEPAFAVGQGELALSVA